MKKSILVMGLMICLVAFRYTSTNKIETKEIDAAINKSLTLLQASSHTFLANAGGCHSCHSQGLGDITFALAKEKGFALNDTLCREALDSILNHCNDLKRFYTESEDALGLVISGGYDLWALSANRYKPQKTIALLTRDIMQHQAKEGYWIPPGSRPPLEYYTFTATALAIRGMKFYASSFMPEEVARRTAQARSWLINTIPQANEEKAFQLLGLTWADADPKIIRQQATKLVAVQHEDGGWSQLDSLQSDAYATGQSLFALNQSGQLKVDEPAYIKGLTFLLRTQYDDGSWNVKTRSFPVIPYVNSGFPHGDNQFISAAGSSWATMALILAAK